MRQRWTLPADSGDSLEPSEAFRSSRSFRRSLARLISALWILGERAADDASELAGKRRVDVGDRPRRVLEDRREDRQVGVTGERALPGGHLIEHHSQGKQIGPPVDRPPLRLLGRHVGHRAQDASFGGDRRGVCGRLGRQHRRAGCAALRLNDLGQPEVEHFDASSLLAFAEHDVAGLEVAMRDPFLVRGRDGVRDGNPDRQHSIESAARSPAAPRPAIAPPPAPSSGRRRCPHLRRNGW